jgi:hypothetical protein
MAADMQGVWLINVYAPSGEGKRQEREDFFNLEVPYLMLPASTSIIVGGDSNCVLEITDSTGHYTYSRALTELVRGFHLVDVWAPVEGRREYTLYTRTGATRIDRIYVTRELLEGKCGTETIVTALSDHLAVLVHMALNVTIARRGRGLWRINVALLKEVPFREKLLNNWVRWKQRQKYYGTVVDWWERMAKKQLRTLFVREGAEGRHDEQQMENFYYACIYILHSPHGRGNRIEALNMLKAKIVRLHSKRLEGVNIDVGDQGSLRDERVSLFHLIKRRTRRAQRNVTHIVGRDRRTKVERREIVDVFHEYLCQKYAPIKVDNESAEH